MGPTGEAENFNWIIDKTGRRVGTVEGMENEATMHPSSNLSKTPLNIHSHTWLDGYAWPYKTPPIQL